MILKLKSKDTKSSKLKPIAKKIKDSDVDDAIKGLQERFAEFKDVDRVSKTGDYIRFEYLKVVIDGEERSEVKNPNYPVELGGENKIKDFDKGLIGHGVGEIVDIDIKFPNDYAEADVAGKSGQFQVKITAVQEKIIPEVNEEFMKKLGDFSDEAAFRTNVKKNIEKEEEDRSKNVAYNEAIEKIVKENSFDVPPARIEQFIDYMYNETTKYNRPGSPLPSREEIDTRYTGNSDSIY